MIFAHDTDVNLAFYNDRVKEIVDASLIAEPFTYVPIVAGHMELIGGNAVVFGEITEGYDVVSPQIETEITYEDISLQNTRINLSIQKTPTGTVITNIPIPYNTWTEYHKGDIVWHGGPIFKANQTNVGGPTPDINPAWDHIWWDESGMYRAISGVIIISIPFIVYVGALYYIVVTNEVEGIASTAVYYEAQAGDTAVDVKAGLMAALLAAGIDAGDVETGPWTNCVYLFGRTRYFKITPVYEEGDISTVYKDFTIGAFILNLGDTVKYPQLKCGAVHAFGIVYKDRSNRTCSVVKTDEMSVYIPFYTEELVAGGNLMEAIINLKFKISNTPPVDSNGVCWAEHYEIVYYGNISMDYFLQLRIDSITEIPLSTGNRFSLNILETLEWTWDHNNRWKVSNYDWQHGDRIRLFGTIDSSTAEVSTIYYGGAIGAGFVYDYEIEATGTQYDEEAIGGDYLIIQAVERPEPFAGESNILAEIYRPRKGLGQTVAYGTGMVFDIGTDIYGHKYHKGDVDQVLDANGVNATPAEVDNTANDCWKFLRLNYHHATTEIQPFWAESIFPSDWWGGQTLSNKLTSMGFPFLDDLSQRQTVLRQRGRHGGFMITGTRTNNIAHFTYDDFFDLPEKDGEITGLREVGFTLKIFQRYKETSIYINRIQTFNPDGTEQFALTDKFLGTMRPMETDYGCQHPDSIMVNGRNIYYWDNSQGELIRSAPNGQVALSDPRYKMSRWFKDLVQWIMTHGGASLLEVRIGANNEHEEVWITYRMGDEVQGVIFSEKQGRFTSRINQITESYVHLGNFFAHLYRQRLWIMNVDEGQDYLTWVGVPTYAEVEVVSNIESLQNKVYHAIALFADHQLNSLPQYVYIPEEGSAGNNMMETNVPLWERREGIFFGEILKDINSKGSFISLNDRKMNGNAMRGRYCYVRLNTEEHDEKVKIDSIVIFSTPSERNV